ncbi:hypothetical protein ABGT15_12450 [Flavobacterium enshiense]|uniref:hypothetical protein n=1 Tax=Flavobacterium enshiense TaxID=1341165 RepID=UPI00345D133A
MKKIVLFFAILVIGLQGKAQELFVYTEPASNLPSNVLSARLMASFYDEKYESGTSIHYMPEIKYGITNKLMVMGQAYINNSKGVMVYEGEGIYAQYKFLNNDDVKKHYRMAAYARLSRNNSEVHQEELEIVGHNTGYELGVIGTQLLHKVAISGSLSFEKALDNGSNSFPDHYSNSAVNYTFSVGKLMLPKKYTGYDQTNFNLMLEFLGQRLNDNGKSYLDIAPSVQFIIKSRARLDLGYRHQLYSDMYRSSPNGFQVRLEYNFYNAFKSK